MRCRGRRRLASGPGFRGLAEDLPMDSVAAVRAHAPIRARILADWDEAPGLAESWDRLLERAGGCSVFQTLPWQQAWWEAFGAGRQLLPVVAHAGPRLVGVAPL